jgi:putative spermidine/putrescine transport system permease protein
LPTGFTGRWYAEVLADPSFRRAFMTSVEVAALTCLLNIAVGLPLAYALYASSTRWLRACGRLMALLPIAVPELVLAFGFILVFSSDALPWLGSLWLLVAAHLVITLPYTVNTLMAGMEQIDLAAYERAAVTLGAGTLARFRDLTLPLMAASLTSSLLMVATLSLGEFQLSNLIAGFLSRTYPVVLLQAFYGATGFACAATIMLLVLALLASAARGLTARVAGTV